MEIGWPSISALIFLTYLAGIGFCLNNINSDDCHFQEDFKIEEASIQDIQQAFALGKLKSRELVDFYLNRIETLNPLLRSVIEVNPDAREQADEADRTREWQLSNNASSSLLVSGMLGIPVLLKDSIGTKDKLNTTAGSYALLGSKVPRDAGVVKKLREAGAVILGKASMSEWYHLRCLSIPEGWCARSGQAVNPYVPGGETCGSSSGSAISVAANMAAVSLGTETDGSIICPADYNSVVGLKPTVGLISRAGVIPVSPRQDSIGTICRTVSDAVYVLDTLAGFDPRDPEATKEAAKFIPSGGYKQFLNRNGLKGKRLGLVRNPFSPLSNWSSAVQVLETHLKTFRLGGATIIDNLEISNVDLILDPFQSGEMVALLAELKHSLTVYLQGLTTSPVRSLADIIVFNENHSEMESSKGFDCQDILIAAESADWIGSEGVKKAIESLQKLSQDGFEKLILDNDLDAMVTLGWDASTVLAIGGYPAITVPAGYDVNGMPFGILFGGLKGVEPNLIEIAYAFEQATMIRKPPLLNQLNSIM